MTQPSRLLLGRWRLVGALALPLLVVAALAGGCGGGTSEEEYKKAYRPINDRLLDIGQDVGTGLETARGKKNKQLSEEFARYALRLQALNTAIRRADTPDEFKDESDRLSVAIDDTVEDLRAISGSAGVGDRQGTAAAVVDFGVSSAELNRAQNALARATGARVGPK